MARRPHSRRPRWIRAILALFPVDFRADFGAPMQAVLEEQQQQARSAGGRRGSVLFRVRALVDALRTAPREHADVLRQDVGFALRVMNRSRGFTLAAVTIMALGIGASTAVFTLVNAVLIAPLPLPESDRLVVVRNTEPKTRDDWSVSYANAEDWRRDSRTLEHMAVVKFEFFNLTGAGEPTRLRGMRASPEFFPLLQIRPVLGRGLVPGDSRTDGSGAMVIGHGLWQRQFGGAQDVVGRSVALNGYIYTVVGVLPQDFRFPLASDLIVSLNLHPDIIERGNHAFTPFARLRPGATLDDAQADLAAVVRRLEPLYPVDNLGWGVKVEAFRELISRESRPALLLLLAAVVLVLLIGCVNIGTLLMARSSARRGELAVRMALGARRGRLVRQLITESLAIAAVGGTLGVFLAATLVPTLSRMLPPELTSIAHLRLDPRVLAFGIGLSVATGLVFGFSPAFRISGRGLLNALRHGSPIGSSVGARGLRGALVVSEVALATVLLVVAGLLLESMTNLRSVDPGFRTDGVLALELAVPRAHYQERDRVLSLYRDLLAGVSGLPGVRRAALVNHVPLGGFDTGRAFIIEGRPLAPLAERVLDTVGFRAVSADYFDTMGIPIRRGRVFTARDEQARLSPVLINESMARRWWAGQDPIGRRLALGTGPDAFTPWMTVVGVVGDVRHRGPAVRVADEIYVPLDGVVGPSMFLVVDAAAAPAAVVPAIRSVLRRIDPDVPFGRIQGMEDLLDASTSTRRAQSRLMMVAAVLALLLSMIGLYGVVWYRVAQRTQEFGLRMALGATSRHIMGAVLRQAMAVTIIGALVGLVGAWGLSGLLASQLFGVSRTDPTAYGSAAAVLMVVSLVATLRPAYRAARVDPLPDVLKGRGCRG